MTVDTRIKAALLLGLALIAFVGSDRWFSILDDESEFVAIANQPLSATIDDYLYGNGHPEHPPLADILLHWWLPIGGAARWSLRLPSVLFFLAGLLGFAQVARRVAGDAAFVLLLLLGVLWPFGFHFGRLAGWYSLCFLLVAALTLAYLRYLECPSRLRLGVFLIAAVLLVYTSYYGWAIVGCLLIDLALIRRYRESLKFLGITIGTLTVAYLPLWRVRSRPPLRHARDAPASSPPTRSDPPDWRQKGQARISALPIPGCAEDNFPIIRRLIKRTNNDTLLQCCGNLSFLFGSL